MSKRLFVYVAGPMTRGPTTTHLRNAYAAARHLLLAGHFPSLPQFWFNYEIVHGPTDITLYMRMDLAWIERCDIVLRLPGESVGADMETAYARKIGKPIYYDISKIPAAPPVDDLPVYEKPKEPWKNHKSPCMWSSNLEDDDWNGSTLSNYRAEYGMDPPCTCLGGMFAFDVDTEDLKKKVEGLEGEEREVIDLFYMKRMGIDDIAKHMSKKFSKTFSGKAVFDIHNTAVIRMRSL